MPLQRRVVEKWKFDCLGFETNSVDEVTIIYCKICRKFSELENVQIKRKGFAKVAAETYVRGTSVIKKNNFNDHILKSQTHASAVLRVSKKENEFKEERPVATSATPTTVAIQPKAPKETTLMQSVKRLHEQQRHHLIKKMQIAHFTVSNAKSFNFYGKLSKFCTDTLKVDLGNGYMHPTAGIELIDCLMKSSRQQSITEPLNTGKIRYYSILNGGNSVTTKDEKELFLMKTARSGVPTFSVMSLEEPEEVDADGLKKALENSLEKMELTIFRKNHELGLHSDGTAVNLLLFDKVKTNIGDHYVNVRFSSHSLELAIRYAFHGSEFNNKCEEDLSDVYNFFKGKTLRWRLFKRQAVFIGVDNLKYKRPVYGTRWVEHQIANINSHNHNLPILIAFMNQQIENPHNSAMNREKVTLESLRSNINHTNRIIFSGVKQDILMLVQPLIDMLQENSLFLPPLLSCCIKTLESIQKLDQHLTSEGSDALKRSELFPNGTKLINEMSTKPPPETKTDTEVHSQNNYSLFYRSFYRLYGGLQDSLEHVCGEILKIVKDLHDALKIRLKPIIEDPLFQAIAIFLDTGSYGLVGLVEILEKVNIIVKKFDHLLKANGCNTVLIQSELKILFEYSTRFLLGMSPNQTWSHLFTHQHQLGITNVIHIAEISITIPASNAESENLFSFLQRNSSTDRQPFTNENLENILRLRCDRDISASRYEHAVDLFLTEHSNGETHEQPQGKRRKFSESLDTTTFDNSVDCEETKNIEHIDVNLISSDEWTDSDTDSDF